MIVVEGKCTEATQLIVSGDSMQHAELVSEPGKLCAPSVRLSFGSVDDGFIKIGAHYRVTFEEVAAAQ